MRSFVIFAGVIAALGVFAARQADKVAATHAPSALVSTAESPAPPTSSYGSNVILSPDRQGHFHTQARVDGRHLEFLVDTGATTIALTARSAAALGIHPSTREFSTGVRTANGVVQAAPVRLGMVEVEGIIVRDVAALVLPDQVLAENLLGMSFLSRLHRYEYSNGRLVLEQ